MLFSEYMNEWLYGQNGYYNVCKKIGKNGDFYTSVSSSKYFGGTIAYYIFSLINTKKLPKNTTICEIGADKGYMFGDVIEFLYTFDKKLLKTLKFVIVEPLKNNQKSQKKYLFERLGDVEISYVNSLQDLSENVGFIFANELFDAMPCELFDNGKIAYVENHAIIWKNANTKQNQLAKRLGVQKAELPICLEAFLQDLTKAFKKFLFVSFDYGAWENLQRFSLRTYKNHTTKPFDEIDFKASFQLTDLTYDVGFKNIQTLAKPLGIRSDYSTQLKALMDFGILEVLKILEKNVPYEVYLKELATVKTLIEPSLLGERFKCIKLWRALDDSNVRPSEPQSDALSI